MCTVVGFKVHAAIGELWLRAGRIEEADGELLWLAEAPAFEGLRLRGSHTVDLSGLAALPDLLGAEPEIWPLGDISVVPEDIDVRREGAALVVTAVVRNTGTAAVRGAHINVSVSVTGRSLASRDVVVDIPEAGTAQVKLTLPFAEPYGAVVVHAMQLSEHQPHEWWTPDPTPDDSLAFRIVDPHRAPKGYASFLIEQCVYICRGY